LGFPHAGQPGHESTFAAAVALGLAQAALDEAVKYAR